MAGDLEGPGKNRTWARPALLGERRSGTWASRGGVWLGEGGTRELCVAVASPGKSKRPCPPLPAGWPVDALQRRHLSFPQWGPPVLRHGRAGARLVLCALPLSVSRGPACVPRSEPSRSRPRPGQRGAGGGTPPGKGLLTQVSSPPIAFQPGVKPSPENPTVPWKSAERPFCTAPHVPGAPLAF